MSGLVMKERYPRFTIKYATIALVMAVIFIVLLFPVKGHAADVESYDYDSQEITFTLHEEGGTATNEGDLPTTGEKVQMLLLGLGAVLILVSVGVLNKRKEVKR